MRAKVDGGNLVLELVGRRDRLAAGIEQLGAKNSFKRHCCGVCEFEET